MTPNCVYYWKCIKSNCKDFPKCEYLGLTSRPYRNRLAEHKQYIKSKLLEKPSGFHFNKDGHNLSHLAGLVLENVKSNDSFVLRARELYIQKFDCYRNELNKEPWSSQLGQIFTFSFLSRKVCLVSLPIVSHCCEQAYLNKWNI